MKEIVKVLLQEGVDEETIHRVIDILEDIPSQINKKYPKETFSDKEYERKVHDKNDELHKSFQDMQQRKEKADKERAIGKQPEAKPKKDNLFSLDIDFGSYDTPEQREYEKREAKFDRQQRLKNTSKNSRGEAYTTNRQFPEGTDRAARRAAGRRKK